MSFIRFNEDRKYLDGESGIYVYPNSEETAVGMWGGSREIRQEDLAELALRVVERTDVDEVAFEEVVEAVQEEYSD